MSDRTEQIMGDAQPVGYRVTADELVALTMLLEVDALPGLSDLPIPDDVSAVAGHRGLVARGLITDLGKAAPTALGALTISALIDATSRCMVIDSRPGRQQCSSWSLGPRLAVVAKLHDIGVYDILLSDADQGRRALGNYLTSLEAADEADADYLAAHDALPNTAVRITARSTTGDANEFWISDVLLVCCEDRIVQVEPDVLTSAKPALDELQDLLALRDAQQVV